MALLNGARLLARTVRLAGDGPIFTLSGHQILPIYDAGLDEGSRFIDTRHEAAAVHMADAWGRLTTRPGICLVTAAPGHANTLGAVATAWMSESPLLLFSGGTDVADIGRGGFQEIDQVAMIEPVCKLATMVTSAVALPGLIATALRTAQDGVPGPVHITVPYDVLEEVVDEADVAMPSAADFSPTPRAAVEADIRRAVELLSQAKRPVLLGRPSAWRGLAGERLRSLLELVGLPGVPIDSAVGLAEPSLHGVGADLPRCDLAILLASQDFAIDFAGPRVFGEECRLIQVAPEGGSIGQNRAVDVGLVGDAATVLGQLLEAAGGRSWPSSGWRAELDAARRERLERTRPLERTDQMPIHPSRVVTEVRSALRPGDCVALDGGDFVRWARWALGGGPYQLLVNGKLGGLGSGIPFAMAATLAQPEARAVALIGDGTFGFHGMELDTAVRHNLPIVVVVGNDGGWGTERQRQRTTYGPERVVAADLLPTRYDRVAAALGAHGEHVERPEQLGPAVERALASRRPACINVSIASVGGPAGVV